MSATLNSSPNFRTGDRPTALTWNNDFAEKVDAANGYASGLVIDGGIVSNSPIDNSVIGGQTPAPGSFTLLKASRLDSGFPVGGNLSIDGNGVLQASGTLGVSSITFGTGLSGGTITGSGSVAVLYGTIAGTAAQGNDSRFATIPTQPANVPLMDGSANVGTSISFAREDHVHPTDTSRAPLSNPNFTDMPRATDATTAGTSRFDWYVSSGGTDAKWTDAYATPTSFGLQFVNDAFSAGSAFLTAWRSGYAVTAVDITAPAIRLHGNVTIDTGSLAGYQPALGFTPVRQGTGNVVTLWWDGTGLSAQVDASYLGTLATYGYVQSNFATYAWVNSTFWPASYISANYATWTTTTNWVNSAFKPIWAYTPNQSVDYGSQPTFGNLPVATLITTATDPGTWSFYHSGNVYIRYQGIFDYGPVNYVSDIRLKRDIAPSETDCLDVVKRFKVQKFRWKDPENATAVPAGLVTQQLKEVHPSVVHEQPPDAPPGATFYESVNPTIMCALLVGAVQQLSAEVAALKAAMPA